VADGIVMHRNLMAKDEFKNLGFAEEGQKEPATAAVAVAKVDGKKGEKGELRW
jgi:hypothetical protein